MKRDPAGFFRKIIPYLDGSISLGRENRHRPVPENGKTSTKRGYRVQRLPPLEKVGRRTGEGGSGWAGEKLVLTGLDG